MSTVLMFYLTKKPRYREYNLVIFSLYLLCGNQHLILIRGNNKTSSENIPKAEFT